MHFTTHGQGHMHIAPIHTHMSLSLPLYKYIINLHFFEIRMVSDSNSNNNKSTFLNVVRFSRKILCVDVCGFRIASIYLFIYLFSIENHLLMVNGRASQTNIYSTNHKSMEYQLSNEFISSTSAHRQKNQCLFAIPIVYKYIDLTKQNKSG